MISKEQQAQLRRMADAANKRLARASEGQRQALKYYIRNYDVIEGKSGIRFKTGAAKTEAEYEKRLKQLNKFLNSKMSSKKGFQQIKKEAIKEANRKLSEERSYDFTDEEIAIVLEETEPKKNTNELYNTLDLLTAYQDPDSEEELTRDDIIDILQEALENRITEYDATLAALKKRAQSEPQKKKKKNKQKAKNKQKKKSRKKNRK